MAPRLVIAGTLSAAAVALFASQLPPSAPASAGADGGAATGATVGTNGIGPLQLDTPLLTAAERALPLDAAAAQVGPGCDSRDQVAITVRSAGVELAVMAMANADGRIEEVIALPRGIDTRAGDAEACRRHGAAFARRFTATLGEAQGESHLRKPASDEYTVHFSGGAAAQARWFPGGASCDLALQFRSRSAS